jgi:4-carboxymuconolactone decarboxylase
MPDRYPPIPPSQLTPEQHKAYDEGSETAEKLFGHSGFLYKNEDGAFIGPFAPLLYTPKLLSVFFELVTELGNVSGFSAKAKETVILATGSHFKADYEMYAHGKIAERKSDLTDAQIRSIKEGDQRAERISWTRSVRLRLIVLWSLRREGDL